MTRTANTSKAAQARAQREAKAAEAEAAKATTEPSTTEPSTTEAAALTGWVDLPASKRGGGTRGSVWTDRLNEVADGQADNPGKFCVVFTAKQAKGASVRASDLRKKLKEATIPGLAPGGTFQIVTRGSAILACFVPTGDTTVAPADPQADVEADREEAAKAA